MRLKVSLLRPFSDAAGARELEVDMEDGTIDDFLVHMVSKYPKLKDELYEDDGELTDYIILFVNGKPANALDGTATALRDGDEVLFFVPISGG